MKFDVEELKKRLSGYIAERLIDWSAELHTWCVETINRQRENAAYADFPVGCAVRLIENGCCNPCHDPANREGIRNVVHFSDHGDFYLRRPDGSKAAFVHANGMQRVWS